MERLRPGWFLEGLWDEEYQRYRLLAYLQRAYRAFLGQQLYPPLGDLIEAYRELLTISEARPNPDLPQEEDMLYRIVSFALPRMEEAIEEGRSLYETIERHLQVEVVGIIPMYKAEGYVFLRRGTEPVARAYRYEVRPLQDQAGQIAILLEQVEEFSLSGVAVPMGILRERLLQRHRELPAPLTIAVESPWHVPLRETLLPIVKRSLLQWLAHLPNQGIA
jgi:hypothetical protein